MKNSPQLLVIGSYAVGLVMQTKSLPRPGETVLGYGYRATHGGKGSNQAVQAARLGASVAFLGRIGKDSHGEACRALHESDGICTDWLLQDSSLPTGVGFIVVDEQGQNLIALDMGANGALSPADLHAAKAAFGHAQVILAQLEIPLETALEAMRLGRAHGATTILNPAPAAFLGESDLSCVDYLIPNETELRVCAGLSQDAPADEAIAVLLRQGCKNIIVTLGENGCQLCPAQGSPIHVPTFPVTSVDTVGAGDSFCGAFATALCEKQPPGAALRFANAAAALSVTKPDTVPSYHHRHEVEALLK